jgi:hypothetical protein
MANERGKRIDNTHLSADMTEERQIIHRDLIAHSFRWSHVAKYLHQGMKYKTARVLDVGCGVDTPLARMFYSNRLIVDQYVGIEYNPARKIKDFNFGKMPADIHGGSIFPRDVAIANGKYSVKTDSQKREYDFPNLVTCFEVLEHVEPGHARKMVAAMLLLLKKSDDPNATAFISTPCWNVKNCAANHVNEMRYQALGRMFEDVGFAVVKSYGTFASISDYREQFFKDYGDVGKELYERTLEYYDTNVFATIFAPLYPHLARNAIWKLQPAKEGYVKQFPEWADIPQPWTSSEEWADLSGDAV